MGSRRLLVGRAAVALPLVMVLAATACGAPGTGETEAAPTAVPTQLGVTPVTAALVASDTPTVDSMVPPSPPPPYPEICATPLADGDPVPLDDWSPAPVIRAGLRHVATAGGGRFTVHTAGGDRTFLNGVNLGSALPGTGPGEWMAGRRTYTAWLRQIGALGFRSIRTYTLHPAAFYDALATYNLEHPTAPIYLMQGVWFPQDQVGELPFITDPELTEVFDRATADTIDALGGRTFQHPDPRLGSYTTDVTPWLAGLILGVEWDPALVAAADGAASELAGRDGRYVAPVPAASPTERWLAARLDAAAQRLQVLGVAAPLSFVNWAPTDPLQHPTTVDPSLDRAAIDPTHVLATDAWPAGLFASYHTYPYFPEFLETEPGIADYALDGVIHPYAGYLAKLRDHHGDLPVVIAETGVPSGWVEAGYGPGGRNYGGLFETAQMQVNADLVDTARRVGMGGSMVFEWADEWFKPTWNVADLDVGNGPAWHNLLSPEQHFGIVAVEPVPAAVLDGAVSEWGEGAELETGGEIEISAAHDAAGITVMVQGALPETFEIRFDTDPGLVHRDELDSGSDVTIRISQDSAQVLERTGYAVRLTPVGDGETPTAVTVGDPGTWEPFTLLTAYAIEGRPAATASLGMLRRSAADGTGTVPAEEAGWARTNNVVEVRVPWTVPAGPCCAFARLRRWPPRPRCGSACWRQTRSSPAPTSGTHGISPGSASGSSTAVVLWPPRSAAPRISIGDLSPSPT